MHTAVRSLILVVGLVCGLAAAQTQKPVSPALLIGDPAPPLEVMKWLKGAPVKAFEPGKVYVVEFWATW